MDIIAETGNLPVNRTAELAPDSGVLADIYTVFGNVSTDGSLLPYLDYATPTFGETLGQSLQNLLDGRLAPKDFVKALEADYTEFVESNG
jgi:raffinose/stachyose/melibiose transport system substrate-binding protein